MIALSGAIGLVLQSLVLSLVHAERDKGELMTRCEFARKSIALTLIAAMLIAFVPASGLAQDSSGDACVKGTADGEAVDTAIWFIAGCALGVTGWLIAYMVEPSPPAGNMIGKDSAYTMQYLSCYKSAAKAKQSKAALTGCAISTGVTLIVYVILLATMDTDPDPYYY